MISYSVDLTNCEKEPIHIVGSIQSHGYLLVLAPDTYTILHTSANIHQLLGQPADKILGQSIETAFSATDLPAASVIEVLNVGRRNEGWQNINPQVVKVNGQAWNLIIHEYDGLLLVEWEPLGTSLQAPLNQRLIAEALTEVQASRHLMDLLQNTARRIRTIIGFDRVMVYRFAADWHGQVIAEEKEEHLEPFLGLHYPASDIPKQARELYKLNLVRLIADVHSTPAAILSTPDWPVDRPVDLTHSTLRAVSPIHIEYLKNMGVAASMSISLLYRDELWGLISCHHYTPRFVDYNSRQAAKFVSQLLSAALEFRKDEEDKALLRLSRENIKVLQDQLQNDGDVVKALTRHQVSVMDLTTATGAVLVFNNQQHRLGNPPDDGDVRDLLNWLKASNTDSILITDELPKLYPEAENFRAQGAGLLAIVLSHELNEYLLWFKPEQVQQVTWAGDPNKPVTLTDDGKPRISPRTSFAAWTELVRNRSESWSEAEVSMAVKLREDILEVVNRQANEIRVLNQRLQTAYEELDAFSYTVSHDLRTPLSSIRCYSEILLEEYGADFNPDARALFQKIMDSTDRMRALIRHILYYSRMGRTDINTQRVDVAQMIQSIWEEILIIEKDRALTLSVSEMPSIHADPVMIRQLFMNLLANAAKYTRLAPQGEIRVEAQETDKEVIYTVSDNGIGFSMKEAGRIFELFKRLENARSFKGSGVGLTIVKRIVNRHNGKIWYHSEPNRGTTFFVSFPRPVV